MREQRGKVEGDLVVSDALAIHGMVTGSITVRQGGLLQLHGMCCGSLTVEAGASATTFGMVCGNVRNQGGQLSVNGMVTGSMTCNEGETALGPDSRVLGGIDGKVILACKSCAQRLSVPGRHQELQVTCPKCRASWKWTPAGTASANSKDQEIVAAVFRNIDFASVVAAAQTNTEPAVPAAVEPTVPERQARGSRPWWRFW